LWREENRRTQRKTLGARTRINNKLNPLMAPDLGFEPGSHWWEASGMATAPSLLPLVGARKTITTSLFPSVIKLLTTAVG